MQTSKLVTLTVPDTEGRETYRVNPAHVIVVDDFEGGSRLFMADGTKLVCDETPDDIDALFLAARSYD